MRQGGVSPARGDVLTVVSLDRLGRSLEDLIGIVGRGLHCPVAGADGCTTCWTSRIAEARYHRLVAITFPAHDPECGADLAPAVALFRSLADPTRLAIVHELARAGERRIVDLTKTLGWA